MKNNYRMSESAILLMNEVRQAHKHNNICEISLEIPNNIPFDEDKVDTFVRNLNGEQANQIFDYIKSKTSIKTDAELKNHKNRPYLVNLAVMELFFPNMDFKTFVIK